VKASGRGLLVAVIDSGINAGHPHVGPVLGGLSLRPGPRGIVEGGDFSDRIGHGTACAGVIREFLPLADLFAVKIFEDELRADAATVAAGIRLAVEHGARLINLSLAAQRLPRGSARESWRGGVAELAAACRAAARNRVALIAARPPGGIGGVLGALSGRKEVLVAAADPRCPANRFYPVRGSPRTFRTSPFARPIPGLPQERNFQGPSLAAARLTGFAGKVLEAGPIPAARLRLVLGQLAVEIQSDQPVES
jgi:hypothetical protein